jgi:serine/threonine protein kinase
VAEDESDPTSALRRTDLERPFPTSGSPALPLRSGTVLGGRYEIGKTIGQGGMGVVVQAFDRTLGVEVAIKIVRAEYAGEREWSERLAREVKLARQIQHANVCRVFDYAQADGRAFLIMELATGGTLRDELHADATAARPLAARIADARAIAAGLAAIHAAGIVHRDISPQNALRMSDGRLVLSDFGLATDSFDGTTSIRGGTVAYMAPEVARGGRATVAADIWGLGAVIYESVFGQRLQWDPESGEMRSAVGSRRLTPTERSVLEICNACLAPNSVRRPRDAGEIAARLSEAGLARSAGRRWRRQAATVTGAAFLIAGVVVAGQRIETARRRPAQAATAPLDPLMIFPTGDPDDWTAKSKVMAEIPTRIRCLVRLPDHHTVRFVWGDPAQAEDVDTRTGKRSPSPLSPDAYAEGCPDLSPDGKRLVYAGHTADDRAYAFVSNHPDGRDAVPVVPTAEPSMNSDPVWLNSVESFVYDADANHVGVFSMDTKRSMVLPTANAPFFTSFHGVGGDTMFAWWVLQTGVVEVDGFSYPRLDETLQFRLPEMFFDLTPADGSAYYGTISSPSGFAITRIEPLGRRARLLGKVDRQAVRYPLFVEGGMAFISVSRTASAILHRGAETRRVALPPDVRGPSLCGDRLVAQRIANTRGGIIWLDLEGKEIGNFQSGDRSFNPRCSRDGRVLFYGVFGQGMKRCRGGECDLIFRGDLNGFVVSPDDNRIAFESSDSGGHAVRWIYSDGREGVHELVETDTQCSLRWSNAEDLWVALRKGRRVIWTELDTNTSRPTGRTFPGTRDCTDGNEDPAAPVREAVEEEDSSRVQLRLLPEKYLPGR